MNVTPMTKEHLQQYARMLVQAFGGAPWNEPWTLESAAKRIGQYMDTGNFLGLELEENGESVAFILGQREQYYDGPRFYIQEFCCVRQGGGYGTKLLGELEKRLKEEGVVRTYLMTIHGDATEGYYQRRGYITDPDAIWMYKTDL